MELAAVIHHDPIKKSQNRVFRRKAEERTMNRTSWERILTKYAEPIGPGKKVIIVFKNARDHASGLIKEIDEDFLVLSKRTG